MTFPLISLYHSSKWAIEGFSESLAFELGELGIQVKLIEPGGVDTDFGGRSMAFAVPQNTANYNAMLAKFQEAMGARASGQSTAAQIAAGIYEATTDGKIQLRYLLGNDAKEMYAMRQQAGDDVFIAGMRKQMLS